MDAPGSVPAERSQGNSQRSRRLTWLVVAAVVVVVAGFALVILNPFGAAHSAATTTTGNSHPTSLYTVTRQDLSSQTQVPATLGYAGTYSAVNQEPGIVTAVPAIGQTLSQGGTLYRVNDAPVVLLYGSTPAYRSLFEGMTGDDVAELNADLIALGYATSSQIPSGSTVFSYWTARAVEKLHSALGEPRIDELALGQVAFLPTALRVTSVSVILGAPVGAGQPVLTATSTARYVSIDLDASEQSEVQAGDAVTISLPNNQNTPGVISSVGTVAIAPTSGDADNSPTITVLVRPTDPTATGTWDQAPVNVTITTASVKSVLAVPIDALLSKTDGGYAVEVAGADGTRHLLSVRVGLFDDADGMVQVSGSGLSAGQRVVVPKL